MSDKLATMQKYRSIYYNLSHVYNNLRSYINGTLPKNELNERIDYNYLNNDVIKCYNEYEFFKNQWEN